MARWVVRCRSVDGEVIHEDRYLLRRSARRHADWLCRPLPDLPYLTSLIPEHGPLWTVEVERSEDCSGVTVEGD